MSLPLLGEMKEKKQHEMLERFKQSIFYYFLSMKNVIFIQILAFSSSYSELSCRLQRIFKMGKKSGLKK